MALKYRMNMCSGRLAPMIIKFTLPLMITSILQLLYNAADIIVVGRYVGSIALSAVGSTSSLISLFINMSIGISVGSGVLLSQAIGANDNQKCYHTVHTSMTASAIIGIVLAIAGFILSKPLLILTGSPSDVIEQATLYMKIYFLGVPGSMICTFGCAILRTAGDTKRPLIFMSISGIINVALNLIMILVFHIGVAGVAIATVVSQYVSAFFTVFALRKSDGNIHLYMKELKIHKKTLFKILRIGLPIGFQSCVFNVSNVLIQSSVNSFGSDVMAGNAAAANIEGFLYVAMNSFGQAVTTFAGQNYGAKKYKRVNQSLLWCLLFVTILGSSTGPLLYTFGKPLIGIYTPDNVTAVEFGMIRMQYICCPYVVCGIMEVLTGAIRGTGTSITPMIVSIIGVCGIRIVWILTIFSHHHTLPTLYVSYILSWTVTSIIHCMCYLYIKKKRLNTK